MKCIYASVTKSGRYKCTYQEEGENNISLSSNNSANTSIVNSSINLTINKMCPFQHFCQKKYEWEHLNQNRCRHYKTEVMSNG